MASETNKNQQEDLRSRCHVGFSITGSSLDFDGISAALNQQFARTWRAGSQTVVGPLPNDIWSIGSPIEPPRSLEEHLHWLRTQLEPHVNYLEELSRTAQMKVYIGFTLFQEQNGFAIPSDFIRLFASFNAFIEMYILCNLGEDWEEVNGQAAEK
jgi:hypothetical protein